MSKQKSIMLVLFIVLPSYGLLVVQPLLIIMETLIK